MSFSGKIKEELAEHSTDARHCNLAELSAIVQMCGHFSEDFKGRITLQVDTENYPVARKCFTLMRKTFNIKTDIVIRRHAGKDNWSYHLYRKEFFSPPEKMITPVVIFSGGEKNSLR